MDDKPAIPYASERPESAQGGPYAPGELQVAPGPAKPALAASGGALVALRALHHSLARASAEGRSLKALAALAADLAGRPWSAAELARLTHSPAFRELVASYKKAA